MKKIINYEKGMVIKSNHHYYFEGDRIDYYLSDTTSINKHMYSSTTISNANIHK